MEAQIKLGRIFGIKIGLHYSWLIIALLIAFSIAGHFGSAHPNWGRGLIWGMEPLHTTEKLESRDEHRWELDPASSEGFDERMKHEGEYEEK